jgi:hypothetical protein
VYVCQRQGSGVQEMVIVSSGTWEEGAADTRDCPLGVDSNRSRSCIAGAAGTAGVRL